MSAPEDFASAAQSLSAAVMASAVDPADAIRLLGNLSKFSSSGLTDQSAIGKAMATMLSATGDVFRRSAVIAMARSSASYQPSSYDDAANIRTIICAALDNEIMIAGDQGEDATYSALKKLRTAVVKDLTIRGANLARIVTIMNNATLPSLFLANRLYHDASRNDELVIQAAPRHPAFMPIRFKSLSQ